MDTRNSGAALAWDALKRAEGSPVSPGLAYPAGTIVRNKATGSVSEWRWPGTISNAFQVLHVPRPWREGDKVNTVEDLKSLPEGSVVRDSSRRGPRLSVAELRDGQWRDLDGLDVRPLDRFVLPATILSIRGEVACYSNPRLGDLVAAWRDYRNEWDLAPVEEIAVGDLYLADITGMECGPEKAVACGERGRLFRHGDVRKAGDEVRVDDAPDLPTWTVTVKATGGSCPTVAMKHPDGTWQLMSGTGNHLDHGISWPRVLAWTPDGQVPGALTPLGAAWRTFENALDAIEPGDVEGVREARDAECHSVFAHGKVILLEHARAQA